MLEANKKSGELTRAATYVDGHKIITDTKYYPGGRKRQKKSEVMYLGAKTTTESLDDFWSVRLAKFGADGQDVRHGTAKSWFANGKPQMDGFYQYGKRSGTFTYWHENGQVASTGEYRDGLAQGNWIWWHENGQKSAVGKYESGVLLGDWRWWNEEGKLTKQQTYDGTESVTRADESTQEVSKKPAKSKTTRH
jgi:antitoxin component YwqK of YwqJK toxin-antitoxin module